MTGPRPFTSRYWASLIEEGGVCDQSKLNAGTHYDFVDIFN